MATTFETVNEALNTDLVQAAALQKKLEKVPPTDPAAMDALNTLRACNNRVDHRVFRALTVLMEEYLVYFEKGTADLARSSSSLSLTPWWDATYPGYSLMQKVLPGLEKYKQTIEAPPPGAQ